MAVLAAQFAERQPRPAFLRAAAHDGYDGDCFITQTFLCRRGDLPSMGQILTEEKPVGATGVE